MPDSVSIDPPLREPAGRTGFGVWLGGPSPPAKYGDRTRQALCKTLFRSAAYAVIPRDQNKNGAIAESATAPQETIKQILQVVANTHLKGTLRPHINTLTQASDVALIGKVFDSAKYR